MFGSYCEVHEENTPTNSMKLRGIPAICLSPTGNIQGTYIFLNLATGLVIKSRQFTEHSAPDLVIKRVATLAQTKGVSPNLVFADRNQIPIDWPDNSETFTGLDPPPMSIYPNIPTKMPGVLLSRHTPTDNDLPFPASSHGAGDPLLPAPSYKIDWSGLADKAAQNADLDVAEHLPPPPEGIEIEDNNDFVYVPPVTPFIKQEPTNSSADSPSQRIPSSPSSSTSTRSWRLSGYLADYHMFTTVVEERHLPPELPYHPAGGTDVDLAIHDEERMAHLCHFVMVHTTTSLELARQGHPTRK